MQTAHRGIANANSAKVDICGDRVEKRHSERGITQFSDAIVGGVNKNEVPIAINQQVRGLPQIRQKAECTFRPCARNTRSRDSQHIARFRFDHANAIIARIADIDIASFIDSNARRRKK